MARSSARSWSQIACNAVASAPSSRLVGSASSQSAYCARRRFILKEDGRAGIARRSATGFPVGQLCLLLDGDLQVVAKRELASLSGAALSVVATYAQVRDVIAGGTPTAVGFAHAVRVARLMQDVSAPSQGSLRGTLGNCPMA